MNELYCIDKSIFAIACLFNMHAMTKWICQYNNNNVSVSNYLK